MREALLLLGWCAAVCAAVVLASFLSYLVAYSAAKGWRQGGKD